MPDIKEFIPEYTPLWRGEDDCGKCDALFIPPNGDLQVMIPAPIDSTTFYLFVNNAEVDTFITFDIVEIVGNHIYANISVEFNGQILVSTLEGVQSYLPCGCYEIELGTTNSDFPEEGVTRLGVKWQLITYCENNCRDNLLKVNYNLDCGEQALLFTYYLDAYLAKLPLTLADEVNAVDGNGRNRRIFSRLQGNKELRVRPLTLATHELLEHVLNLPSFGIDGIEYTQAEGGIYTFVDSGSSGYYVGRVELSATGKVMRLCCEEISPSS